ncbi:MAG: tetratricopeptide repeat protein [Desulfobulbaceae bacterium]|nr:tetratricopeptide repeat protein [Desulfobulbaceae bacterium]
MNQTGFRFYFPILLTILLLSATTVLAGKVEDNLFGEANEAYSRGDYAQAISKYQQITETAGYSPSVLYNLANSLAQSGETGKAILNYERALRLAPSDSDISGNLQLVKKENGLFPKESSRGERFFQLLNLDQWTVLILLALVLVTIYMLATVKYRFSRQLNIGVATSCFLLLSLATAGIISRYQYFNPSVIVSPEVKLFISPFESSASIGALQEGRLVYPQKIHGDFTYVTDETDRKGWIPSAQIESVCKTAHSRS